MNWQSSTMANGARENLVKLGPKLSRLVCQNEVRKRELEKLIKKKNKRKDCQKATCLYWVVLLHSYIADRIASQ